MERKVWKDIKDEKKGVNGYKRMERKAWKDIKNGMKGVKGYKRLKERREKI